jgi:uncharacterized protein (DUF1778 family)
MSKSQVQISAVVSRATKELVEKYSQATGLKKGHMIEMALLHHLRALQELPADVIVPPRLILSKKSGKDVAAAIEKPPKPTKAMKELMSGD